MNHKDVSYFLHAIAKHCTRYEELKEVSILIDFLSLMVGEKKETFLIQAIQNNLGSQIPSDFMGKTLPQLTEIEHIVLQGYLARLTNRALSKQLKKSESQISRILGRIQKKLGNDLTNWAFYGALTKKGFSSNTKV